MRKLLLPSLIAIALGACSTAPTETKPVVETKPTKPAEVTKPAEPVKVDPLAALKDPNNILSKRSVYFEFDKYDITASYQPLVEAHSKFLVSNPQLKVLIQGNTDERGSREYNLALGQKRAEAVKKAMSMLGAKDSQLEAVSLGEEKPKNAGHDEAAWADNRRADVLYSGEY
ncbi:peptidoglycan-associated lipoprotein Pal [Niveibacterium sp. 24ML]|uniref:peptidoglycan-associated lipoprotein Pal n=1 Tax=Niveibacterium sp. 24ML TaxID=2985512 RepID=UPI00226FD0D0|nr:peptidoglycan-associated lipoprotein Pal [Niveibacterium sp. 24ML]MCX9154758.1 peptidoglycan-associated lipoprotein Pal [Niveibacterium sp. 24ML]